MFCELAEFEGAVRSPIAFVKIEQHVLAGELRKFHELAVGRKERKIRGLLANVNVQRQILRRLRRQHNRSAQRYSRRRNHRRKRAAESVFLSFHLWLLLENADPHNYATLARRGADVVCAFRAQDTLIDDGNLTDRKSTRLNSSHPSISYAV